MTIVGIVIAVALIALLVFLVNRRQAAEKRAVEIGRREMAGHRQEAEAHVRRAAELEQSADRQRRFARRHEVAADPARIALDFSQRFDGIFHRGSVSVLLGSRRSARP